MKRLNMLLALLLALSLPVVSATAEETFFDRHGALHVSGTGLADAKGAPVQLRGVSTHGLAWFPEFVSRSPSVM